MSRDSLSLYEVESELRDAVEELLEAEEGAVDAQGALDKRGEVDRHYYGSQDSDWEPLTVARDELRRIAEIYMGAAVDKRDAVGQYYYSLKGQETALAEEINRLRKKKARCVRAQARIKQWVEFTLTSLGIDRLAGRVHVLKRQRAREGVEFIDESRVPRKYCKATWEPRKTPVLEAYKAMIADDKRPEGIPGCKYLPSGKNPPKGYRRRYEGRIE